MNSFAQTYNLNDLAARANQIKANTAKNGYNGTAIPPVIVDNPVIVVPEKKGFKMGGLFWFIIIALIIGLLLFLFRPDLVLSTNTTTGAKYLDWGKLILWSIIFSLIIVFILWLARDSHGMF